MKTIYALLAVIIAIAIDAKNGPLFPDDFYCLVGAGTEIRSEAQAWSRTTSWSVVCDANQMDTGRPCRDVPKGRTTTWTPETRRCVHKTIWDAYKDKLGIKISGSEAPASNSGGVTDPPAFTGVK
jgi:hypothetical protein